MWSYIVLAVLTSSNLFLAAVLYRTRGTEARYRRALRELRGAEGFVATACRERDQSRRDMERFKDLNMKYLRELNGRRAA